MGWAPRHCARTGPAAVRARLTAESARLSPLSVREAAKHL
ncbi:DNA alkylation repair protein [Actinoplanes oblitus]|uniref:DNA alkylation repair protein n=1 Tax=Actinoplanes oblitus TaxID=3040509 RepID=A0ABY8WV10_9ACTN|nr:DNA alkylation repair protein [Actinoplanes oblitus]WIN00753.1 DNA alkylation repair protein [Actinoplanes oblitus]